MWRYILPILISVGLGAQTVKVGYGYSTEHDVKTAVKKAVADMTKAIGEEPDWVMVVSTVLYDSDALIKELSSQLKKAKIYGETSCLGVVVPDGFITGEKGALAVLGVKSDKITFGVGYAEIGTNPRDAGKKAVKAAIADAGKTIKEKPKIILMCATPGEEEDILAGIAEVVGKDVPVYGGSAADNDISGKWKVFARNKALSKGVVLTVVYTDLKIGHAYASGYVGTGKKGVVTKAEARRIYEIDGKPCADVFNEWTGGKYTEAIKKCEVILGPASFTPLARRFMVGKEEKWVSIHPHKFYEDKSLSVFAKVNTGDTLYLIEGSPEILLERPKPLVKKALLKGRIKTEDVAFGIFIYCAGTMLAIKDKFPEIPGAIKTLLGGKPFIGACTFGEQGQVSPAYGNFHGNLMCSMTIFGAK